MKIFYNSDGKVIGSITGATAEIEAGIKIPETSEIYLAPEVVGRIQDPADPLRVTALRVENDEIVVPDAPTS